MTCPDCKGTGRITLLTSIVDCGCIPENNIIDLVIGQQSGTFISCGAETFTFKTIGGMVERTFPSSPGEYEIVIKTATCRFRLITDFHLPHGMVVVFWLEQGMSGKWRIQVDRDKP